MTRSRHLDRSQRVARSHIVARFVGMRQIVDRSYPFYLGANPISVKLTLTMTRVCRHSLQGPARLPAITDHPVQRPALHVFDDSSGLDDPTAMNHDTRTEMRGRDGDDAL